MFTKEQLETIVALMEREIDSWRFYQYGNDEIEHFGEILETAQAMIKQIEGKQNETNS